MKYALVTGASSGIGWHLSKELSEKGYSIVAVSNQPKQLQDLKNVLESSGTITVITLDIDLSRPDSAKEVFDYCEMNQLEIEVLVNNAGMLLTGEATEVEYSRAAAILQLHITTTALLCHLLGKKMLSQNFGYILNVSSISAVMPYPVISFYGPTKTFVRAFTRALRTEMKHQGVVVACLLPGATATALYNSHNVNVPLAMKLGVMKRPEYVARAGVEALFAGRAECIPGLLNKFLVYFLPIVPHFIIGWINKWYKRKNS